MRLSLMGLLLVWMSLSAGADPWHTLRNKAIKRFKLEYSDPQKGINGYHLDCFDERDEWVGGLTFYLRDGFSGKTASLKDLDGLNLRSPIKPQSAGGRSILKMVKEFSVSGGLVHFVVQGKEGEWDLDLRGDLKL
ncbi:hypothetical protein JST97_05885 [bacterium]|nr:hypothetical protein [bacterium]